MTRFDILQKPNISDEVLPLSEVDANGDVENSGQLRHAVPKSCPSSGLYVPLTQATTRLAVHHLPLGQLKATVCVTVACVGAVELTVMDVPSAVPSDDPRTASFTF